MSARGVAAVGPDAFEVFDVASIPRCQVTRSGPLFRVGRVSRASVGGRARRHVLEDLRKALRVATRLASGVEPDRK